MAKQNTDKGRIKESQNNDELDEYKEYDEMEQLEILESLREDMEDLGVTTLGEIIQRIEVLHKKLDK